MVFFFLSKYKKTLLNDKTEKELLVLKKGNLQGTNIEENRESHKISRFQVLLAWQWIIQLPCLIKKSCIFGVSLIKVVSRILFLVGGDHKDFFLGGHKKNFKKTHQKFVYVHYHSVFTSQTFFGGRGGGKNPHPFPLDTALSLMMMVAPPSWGPMQKFLKNLHCDWYAEMFKEVDKYLKNSTTLHYQTSNYTAS